MEAKEMVEKICQVLSDKQASDIISIHLTDLTVIADDFIIASGRSSAQVKGLFRYVDEEMSKIGIEPKRSEGISEGKWIAVDYGDVVVHIFHEETREFYHLDKLWDNGNNVTKYED